MIVAVAAVGVVEVPGDQMVGVVAVGNHFVAAACPMLVRRIVRSTTMRGGAGVGICARDLDHVLVDVAVVSVMHMPIVQVVDMPVVLHLRVRAVGAVRMLVLFVNRVCHNRSVTLKHVRGKNTPLACKFVSTRFRAARAEKQLPAARNAA